MFIKNMSIIKILVSYCDPYNKHDNGNDIGKTVKLNQKKATAKRYYLNTGSVSAKA
jgi:hypothetical protein